MQPRNLKEKYIKGVIPAMIQKFGYKNTMAVPQIQKVVVNCGFGKLVTGKSGEEQTKLVEEITGALALITGQRPLLTKAKKSIAAFKVRKGAVIGAKVTLRGQRLHDFLARLVHIVLPRSRDFEGISQDAFDKKGNLTVGIKEHIFFPEIAPEKVRTAIGLEITVTTNAKTRKEGIELLRLLGFPIKR